MRLTTKAVSYFVTTFAPFLAIANGNVPDYGFPRCYTSFDDYETNFVDDRPNHEVRPLVGAKKFPYTGGDADSCTNDVAGPLIALGPHWSPIGITQYVRSDADACNNCLPDAFGNGTLVVASHGSWNRDPFIGYRVQTYDMDTSDDYSVTSQQALLPPLRHADTGTRLRPVDVKSSPVDDALLMTADRDDLDADSDNGGGLYRIRGTEGSRRALDVSANTPVEIDFAVDLNALGENPANVTLERLASIPCARQIAVSPVDPTILYVSTFGNFCPGRDAEGAGDAIWVVRLDSDDSVVVDGPAILVDNLADPQGIDTFPSDDDDGKTTLYVATGGTLPTDRGNSVLELRDADARALEALAGNDGFPLDGTDCKILLTLVKDYTALQLQHAWRTLRVHPSGTFAIVSIGADCNWSEDCTDNGDTNLHTTLLRVGLGPEDRGRISIAGRGVRNAIGFHFDLDQGNLLFTSFGSDDAAGIPSATSSNNVPDCAVELLEFDLEAEIDYIDIDTFFLGNIFDLIFSFIDTLWFGLSAVFGGGVVVD